MAINRVLTCREITSVEEFERLREPWDALFRACHYPSLFCTWEWAWHWWHHLGAPDPMKHQLLILTVFDESGQLVAIAPFSYPTQTGKMGCLSAVRPLRPLGTRLRCRMEDMTEEPILLLRDGCEAPALQAIISHLAKSRPCWDLTHIRVVRSRDVPDLQVLWGKSGARRARTHQRTEAGQIVALPDSWAEFRASMRRSLRRNLAYYPRLLERDGYKWTIRTARTPEEVGAAVETLIALHHNRSQGAAGGAEGGGHRDHIPGQQFEAFFRQVMLSLADQGRASIVLMEINGVVIAAQAILEYGSMLTFYYSGFDLAWHVYSPITLLNAHVIEEAIGRGLKSVNYLPGAMPWKTRWNPDASFVVDEISWVPLSPRPITAALMRAWRRRIGSDCDCGFCAIPLSTAHHHLRPEPRHEGHDCPVHLGEILTG